MRCQNSGVGQQFFAARLSHEDADAGTAGRHKRTNTAHIIAADFIWASKSRGVSYAGRRPEWPRLVSVHDEATGSNS